MLRNKVFLGGQVKRAMRRRDDADRERFKDSTFAKATHSSVGSEQGHPKDTEN